MSSRVAVIGNMNNGNFALTRYLRDDGIDAHLFLFENELQHFHPSYDTYDDGFQSFVHQLSWGGPWKFPFTRPRAIREAFNEFGFLIGCGTAPAYLDRGGLSLDVFVPFGGDIWTILGRADGNPLRYVKYLPVMRAQARGIGRARVFHMAPTNPLYESQWRRFRGGSQRWYEGVPVVYDLDYLPERRLLLGQRSPWFDAFRRVRDVADLVLFSSVRHFWKCAPSHPAAKGTDRLLRGLALARDRMPNRRVVLVTFEYGRQVAESRSLVAKLGLQDRVSWFPMMPRRDLMAGLAMADIACAEFENSWIASGVLYEALAMGKPILAYRDDALYRTEDATLYPILNAREPEEIADAIASTTANPGRLETIGRAGGEWYRAELVARAMLKYRERIGQVAA